jgi:hypothetical protein
MSMRKVILVEKVRASGRLFELGSLKVYDEQIPINVGFDFAKPDGVVGYADRMQLNAQSGEVSMRINFNPGFSWSDEVGQFYDFTIFATEVESYGSAHLGNQTVTSCRLRAVVLVPIASMPILNKETNNHGNIHT